MQLPWTALMKDRITGKERNTPWWVNNKLKLHEFCEQNGFPMPELLAVWESPEQLDLSNMPDSFVVKPSVMHSTQGVMLLSRKDDGLFFDALKGRTLSEEQILAEQVATFEKCRLKKSYRLIVEELITSGDPSAPIPFDYKIYCFYDQVALIQQIDRNHRPTRVFFFDENFRPLELEGRIESDWKKYHLGEPKLPDQWDRMISIASGVAKKVATPFVRVDMFSAARGPVIGELTAAPGGAYHGDTYRFTDEFDQLLGQYWYQAQERIQADNPSDADQS